MPRQRNHGWEAEKMKSEGNQRIWGEMGPPGQWPARFPNAPYRRLLCRDLRRPFVMCNSRLIPLLLPLSSPPFLNNPGHRQVGRESCSVGDGGAQSRASPVPVGWGGRVHGRVMVGPEVSDASLGGENGAKLRVLLWSHPFQDKRQVQSIC